MHRCELHSLPSLSLTLRDIIYEKSINIRMTASIRAFFFCDRLYLYTYLSSSIVRDQKNRVIMEKRFYRIFHEQLVISPPAD